MLPGTYPYSRCNKVGPFCLNVLAVGRLTPGCNKSGPFAECVGCWPLPPPPLSFSYLSE